MQQSDRSKNEVLEGNAECSFEFCHFQAFGKCTADDDEINQCLYREQLHDIQDYLQLLRVVMRLEVLTERSLGLLIKDLQSGYAIVEPLTMAISDDRALEAIKVLRKYCNENESKCKDETCYLAEFCHTDLPDECNAPCFWLFGHSD